MFKRQQNMHVLCGVKNLAIWVSQEYYKHWNNEQGPNKFKRLMKTQQNTSMPLGSSISCNVPMRIQRFLPTTTSNFKLPSKSCGYSQRLPLKLLNLKEATTNYNIIQLQHNLPIPLNDMCKSLATQYARKRRIPCETLTPPWYLSHTWIPT